MSVAVYTVFLQVQRPMAMRKDGIQTRKRKPKSSDKSKSPKKEPNTGT